MSGVLGLVISSGPTGRPVPRERVDWALAAAGMGLPLRLFFIGDGLLHLVAGRQPAAVDLPDPLGPWRAVLDLADDLQCYRLASPAGLALDQRLPCRTLPKPEMAQALRQCQWLIHV